MIYKKRNKKSWGSSFAEYVLVVGVVSLALGGMNIYVKRGVQARLKDMTDYFISPQQVTKINPTANMESSTNTIAETNLISQGFLAGGTALSLLETTDVDIYSEVNDEIETYNNPFIPAEDGGSTPPDYDDKPPKDKGKHPLDKEEEARQEEE